ncbi:MAG: hypothetical protein JWN46_1057 [Acidimicrobiales bacterium]|nr:hypothetical protein [Acidimicrobiales bacterium]
MEGNEQLAVIIPMLKEVAGGIADDQLGAATPCAAFSVADVLEHMTGLASGFAPMFRGETATEHDGGTASADTAPTARFDRAMDGLLDAVQSAGALDRTITTPGGPLPGAVFARLVALDGLVHGWDLATSTNQPWQPPEPLVAEVDAFAREAISPEMRDGGGFGSEQPAPDGAPTMLRLVAFTGRTLP